jgi:hypothetical protein
VYEKDGEKYFVLDGHVHFWDASPENWIEGQEQYAKGWIECFYGYHQVGPEEYYWPMEKYQKYSEETMMKDPRLSTEGKKKILGLNAARLYDVEVPAELRLPEADTDAQSVEPTVS